MTETKFYCKLPDGVTRLYGTKGEIGRDVSIVLKDDTSISKEGYLPLYLINECPQNVDVSDVLKYEYIVLEDRITKEHFVKSQYDVDPELLQELTVKDYEDAVQNYLDTTVQERGYDNVYTCLSYCNDPYDKFANEADSVLNWRSNVWLKAQAILNRWQSGVIQQPTIEQVIEQLPKLVW